VGVSDRAWGWALGRPATLVVALPGHELLAWAAERALRSRGWPRAASPAEASVLLVAGPPGPLAGAVERLWDQVPAPRARGQLRNPATVDPVLDDAVATLADRPAQHREALALADRGAADLLSGGGTEGHAMGGHSGHDMGGTEGHAMGGHSGHDMGGHEGHDMGGHDHHGGEVAGLPMAGAGAEGAERDGLALDVLPVTLGPLLPDWPPGLAVETTLSGDVVVTASARLEAAGEPGTAPPTRALAAARLADLLAVSGWDAAAEAVRAVRDALADGREPRASGRRWLRRVARSRTLAWLLAGTPAPGRGGPDGDGRSRPAAAVGQARAWARAALGEGAEARAARPVPVEDVGPMLVGLDLAAARVCVAALPGVAATATVHGVAR
jgi:hypothetical protein